MLDLTDPLADLGALHQAALEEHNRGDEFATICMRLIERLAGLPVTQEALLYEKAQKLSVAVARGDGLAADLATCVRLRDQALAEVERLTQEKAGLVGAFQSQQRDLNDLRDERDVAQRKRDRYGFAVGFALGAIKRGAVSEAAEELETAARAVQAIR